MTPHAAIESMQQMGKLLGDKLHEYFDERLWVTAYEALHSAVHFEFGAATPSVEHSEFAHELFEHKRFTLPFRVCLFTAACSPKSGLLGIQTPEYVIVFTLTQVVSDNNFSLDAVPMMFTSYALDNSEDRINWFSVAVNELTQSRKTREPLSEAELGDRSERAWNLMCGLNVLLMSKDVETVEVPAPAKLNARRAKQGKILIRESRVIRIRPEARARQTQAALDYGRKSPKMHWRRGHMRQLNERHGGLIIPIAPQIINAVPDAKPEPKQYQVVSDRPRN